MRKAILSFPSYEGAEPYIYFAFAAADGRRIRHILETLLARGFRVWYTLGPAGGAGELLRRQERAAAASLTMVYLSGEAVKDRELKSALLVNQKNARPILCLDPDGTDRRLAMGLREDIPHLPLYEYRRQAALEEALIRADGVTQELVGMPAGIRRGRGAERLAVLFTMLAAGLLLFTYLGGRFWAPRATEAVDTLLFSDPIVSAAVREAAGGGALTEESVAPISLLRLSAAPESWADLELLPALETIELPQTAALECSTFPRGVRILLTGGNDP